MHEKNNHPAGAFHFWCHPVSSTSWKRISKRLCYQDIFVPACILLTTRWQWSYTEGARINGTDRVEYNSHIE